MNSQDRTNWKGAMMEELEMMRQRDVWSLEYPPPGQPLLPNRWVFTRKKQSTGKIRFRARLVAGGHRQRHGFDYDEVFSPVINFTVIRLCFTILVGQYGWRHRQVDITGAYLYGPLYHTIWMQQPKGFETKDGKACKLRRALYGLHQSGREWYQHLHGALVSIGFKSIVGTNCAYQLEDRCVLLLYVDDMAITGKTDAVIDEVTDRISSMFETKVIGPVGKLLGVHFTYMGKNIGIQQSDYIRSIRKQFPIV